MLHTEYFHFLTFSFIYNLFGPALQDLLISFLNDKVLFNASIVFERKMHDL